MESMQYRNEIMNSFSAGDFSIPSYGENQRVLIFFGDPGFDGSDALEYVAGFKRFNDSKDLIIWVTNLWKPDEKARMLDSIAKTMKADNRLSGLALIKQSRLSVTPVSKAEFDIILSLAE